LKKFIAPALVVAGLSASLLVGATSVSWAQDQPSCAEAISAFIDARNAFEKLPEKVDNPDLVKLAEAVETATDTRDERQVALNAAKAAADTAEAGNSSVGIEDRPAVVARIAELRKFIADEQNPADQRDLARKQLDARLAHLKAIDTLAAAQSDLDAKTKAHQDAPRRIDNPALTKGPELDAMVKAQNAADIACEGQPNDPGPANPGNNGGNDNPPPPAADNDSDDDGLNPGPIVPSDNGSVVTPVGGVETGGGPA
jgi:hypothetical protein